MYISMLRHGIAEDEAATDFDRALTPEGCVQLQGVFRHLVAVGWAPGSILHSPYVRTHETAQIARGFYPRVPVKELDDLAIGSIDGILRACAEHPDPLLVGHEPTLGNLCGRLVGAPAGAIRFERAGFAMVDVDRLPTTRPARMIAFFAPGWVPR